MDGRWLKLRFLGRIIDHLGIQMYQSPVAAIAEIVSNSWDADSENVHIRLPDALNKQAAIVVADDGIGMTLEECEARYLRVGWSRRETDGRETSFTKARPLLGRKGIGKFAGFGVASVITVDTISAQTGEQTVFSLNLEQLRADDYEVADGRNIRVELYEPPSDVRKSDHGTTITLSSLTISRRPSSERFARSLSRRFLLHQRAADFRITVNGSSLPFDETVERAEYVFPRDYTEDERPVGMTQEDGWGIEQIEGGHLIRWRIVFYQEPIGDEELTGVAIFARGKLAHRPFFFNLAGGLSGQHGQQYLSGQVQADYVDSLSEDVIAPERQRINWEHKDTAALESWGQERIRVLLRLWRQRRGEARRRQIESRVAWFSERLSKLSIPEQNTVKRALRNLGMIPTLSVRQFNALGGAILTAWEQGRLKNLIGEMANQTDVTSDWLVSLLAEAEVLVALNLAEAIRTKLEAVRGLRSLVRKGELETAVRDYVAEKPYLLSPKWETFRVETSLKKLMSQAAVESGLDTEEDPTGRKRVDLALGSGDQLLIVEFMRPGKKADFDHLSRCEQYVYYIRSKIEVTTAGRYRRVAGLVVADKIDDTAVVRQKVLGLQQAAGIQAHTWDSLLDESERELREYLEILGDRAPTDSRLAELRDTSQPNCTAPGT